MPIDADAQTVMDAFDVSPSLVRAQQISRFVSQLKAAGVWSKLDALFVLAAHDAQAARVNWKDVATVATEQNSPAFTADRGYTFNGTSNYLATGFVPSTDCTQATGTAGFVGVYERADLGAAGSSAIGANSSSTINIALNPRNANPTPAAAGMYNHALSGGSVSGVTDSRGLTVYQRNGAGGEVFKRGVSIGTTSPSSPGSALVAIQIYIGCRNNAGVADQFRPTPLGAAVIGGVLTPAEHLALSRANQTYMTSVGAAV
ncbi:hypothetical protein [Methylocaldum sp.]|uniref:hypothetical protein n=1 Tax=Methylocaldum sp. TaxID=1969727 RepID=UPI002D2AF38C|nr:hypothetical protein [Methylocaldum sp.]HYE38234.1 hypothetical protein [Methylocaldum sp.]